MSEARERILAAVRISLGRGRLDPDAEADLRARIAAHRRNLVPVRATALDERARASAEMRQFVADAGHQLRTPLTVIVGYLSAIASRRPRESDAPAVTTMLEQSRRMKT